ncbi:hypothetical protein [Nitrospira sp. Nam80]
MVLAMTFAGLAVLAESMGPLSPGAYGQANRNPTSEDPAYPSRKPDGPVTEEEPKPDEPELESEAPTTPEKKTPVATRKPSGNTKIVPSITLNQRYDSNVLFAPSGIQTGLTPWDFVTTATSAIELVNNTRYTDTSFTGGASGSLFINNPDLNFVATNFTATTALDKWVNGFIRGGKLQISDSFGFSPETPSFVSAANPTAIDNPFARGIVPVRATMYTNIAMIAASYPVTPGLVIQGNYSYSLLRIGEIFVRQPIGGQVVFFNTDQHAWSIGPTWRLSRTENIGLIYRGSRNILNATSGNSPETDFLAQGLEASFATTSADWGAVLSGGATILDVDNRAYPTGSLTLSAKYGEATTFQAIGSRSFAPAFFATGGALISTTVGISIQQRFSKVLSFTGSANYAYNEVAPVSFSAFESYTASGQLSYNVSRTVSTSLAYTYTYFEFNNPTTSPTDLAGYIVNRHVVIFSITGKWN